MSDAAGRLPDDLVDSLVAAILAANNYSLEKVWKVLPRLQEEGLTKPGAVTSEDLAQLTSRLAAAGYDRGRLTAMFAERLQNLMKAIDAGQFDHLRSAATRGDFQAFQTTLCRVRGIGPQVARNAWILLQETHGERT
jgi:endonuclease III-like uncharacterized protein